MYEPEQMDLGAGTMPADEALEEAEAAHSRHKRSLLLPRIDAGISPVHINFVSNYDDKYHRDYVTPIFSSMVYRTPVSPWKISPSGAKLASSSGFFLWPDGGAHHHLAQDSI